jgi:hypothetical protein
VDATGHSTNLSGLSRTDSSGSKVSTTDTLRKELETACSELEQDLRDNTPRVEGWDIQYSEVSASTPIPSADERTIHEDRVANSAREC